VEKADLFMNFGPRRKDGDDAQEKREHQHQQTQTVHGKVKMNAEVRHPLPIDLIEPRLRS
jgi:hypothetical protein